MTGRWRLFRHDAGQAAGPPVWVYVALFTACMAIGYWSIARYGSVVIWPANGVLLAAVLQLHRRPALVTLALCFAINLTGNAVRGDSLMALVVNATLNFGEVLIAALIARRVCGAALDMRRPGRLARFALLAAIPAAAVVAMLGVAITRPPADLVLATLAAWFSIDLLGLAIATPVLLLAARGHRFRDLHPDVGWEGLAWPALLIAVTVGVFSQASAPLTFLIFPPLVLVAFRLAPPMVGFCVIAVAATAAVATLLGIGPIAAAVIPDNPFTPANQSPVLRVMPLVYLFMACLLCVALPVSTALTERRRLVVRLRARAEAAVAARLRAEQADAAKSRFLALMSHEMRTPLHSVVGYAEVLGRRSDLRAEARRQAELIGTAGNALLVLVEDVLEVSRGDEVLYRDTAALIDILNQAASPSREVADLKGLRIVIDIDPEAATQVLTDVKRLRQALHKLVCNAVKFTETGHIRLHAERDGDIVRIAVCDTGCGMEPSVLDTIFQPFVQGDDSIGRSHVGAGLGLTVARRLIDRLDGRIEVESRPGHGSTFTLVLPLPIVDAPVEAIAPAPAPTDDFAAPPRVLVVDDHPVNREVARLMLAPTGADIVEAADGIEAVALAASQTFDLILMDVRMPRMDGLEASRAIRALPSPFNAVPILAVTADAMPEDARRCLDAGMDGHLAKPITHTALYAAIDRVMAPAEDEEAVQAA